MMARIAFLIAITALGGACSKREPEEVPYELAQCMADQGWIMYGSVLCSACRAQRKLFGDAFEAIREIECNPTIEGAQVELCLAREVRRTPTWIREREGDVIDRIEDFQLLDDLHRLTGCA